MTTLTVSTGPDAFASLTSDASGFTVLWSPALADAEARQTFINRLSSLACTLADAETFRSCCEGCLDPQGPDALVEGGL